MMRAMEWPALPGPSDEVLAGSLSPVPTFPRVRLEATTATAMTRGASMEARAQALQPQKSVRARRAISWMEVEKEDGGRARGGEGRDAGAMQQHLTASLKHAVRTEATQATCAGRPVLSAHRAVAAAR